MTILLSRIVPLAQLVAVHAPLGEVEWPGTIEHIEATLPEGVPLIFAPVTSGKSLHNRVPRRSRIGASPRRHGRRRCSAGRVGVERHGVGRHSRRQFRWWMSSIAAAQKADAFGSRQAQLRRGRHHRPVQAVDRFGPAVVRDGEVQCVPRLLAITQKRAYSLI